MLSAESSVSYSVSELQCVWLKFSYTNPAESSQLDELKGESLGKLQIIFLPKKFFDETNHRSCECPSWFPMLNPKFWIPSSDSQPVANHINRYRLQQKASEWWWNVSFYDSNWIQYYWASSFEGVSVQSKLKIFIRLYRLWFPLNIS